MWYVQINGHEHKLGRDKVEAWRLYHELMGRKPEGRKTAAPIEVPHESWALGCGQDENRTSESAGLRSPSVE